MKNILINKINFILLLIIFLCCDNPLSNDENVESEVEADCTLDFGGYVDDCGICSGGSTGLVPNIDKDICGVCINAGGGGLSGDESLVFYDSNSDGNDDALCGCSDDVVLSGENCCGTDIRDTCGVCDGDDSADTGLCDCLAVPNGTAIYVYANNDNDNTCSAFNDETTCLENTECSWDDINGVELCIDDDFENCGCDVTLNGDGCCPVEDNDRDVCGLCGGSGITDGECDCDGNVLDCDDVCDGPGVLDGSQVCCPSGVLDCNNVCDGTDEVDACGVCAGAGIPGGDCDCLGNGIVEGECDCDGNILDCDNVCGGPGALDGNTDCCPSGVVDCNGLCDGTAVLDCANVCDGSGTDDCNGDCDGTAALDGCGVCFNGNTGVIENSTLDCNNVCDGVAVLDGNLACCLSGVLDCNNVCDGTDEVDACSVCAGPGIPGGDCDCNGNVNDCNGDCSGTATYNNCGVCIGGATGLIASHAMDDCGDCYGGNNDLDLCNICEGGNIACTQGLITLSSWEFDQIQIWDNVDCSGPLNYTVDDNICISETSECYDYEFVFAADFTFQLTVKSWPLDDDSNIQEDIETGSWAINTTATSPLIINGDLICLDYTDELLVDDCYSPLTLLYDYDDCQSDLDICIDNTLTLTYVSESHCSIEKYESFAPDVLNSSIYDGEIEILPTILQNIILDRKNQYNK